ncbi:hypothetical protein AAIR98_001733 [Elusimicrobium simillimum]|uniref:TadE family protein n=1 Tax=Elusimicrobium simillimum TaxID=3143438 RepID=UPI003C6F25FC
MIRRRGGQTIVELMLVLPVFMYMLFLVLELGNIAYHTILAHHSAYEMARVGALVGVRRLGGPTDKSYVDSKLKEQVALIFQAAQLKPTFTTAVKRTSFDPQISGNAHPNEDLIVELTYPVRLIFPGTNIVFADQPKRVGIKYLKATVRMPVERRHIN